MDKEFTKMWHVVRKEQFLDWTCWLGQPMLYDGGLFVNRTIEEHNANKVLRK